MVRSLKVMLVPNNVQRTKMFQYAGAARFAYNWALGREKENYEKGGKFIGQRVRRHVDCGGCGGGARNRTRDAKEERVSFLSGANGACSDCEHRFTSKKYIYILPESIV